MAADLIPLYLQHPYESGDPSTNGLSQVPSSDDTNNVSWSKLQSELAIMLQAALTSMSNMLKFIATEQQENTDLSEMSVNVAKNQAQQAVENYKKVYAHEHEPWWKKLENALLRYVLPIILCVVAFVIFGPAAGCIAAAVFLATAIPVHNGESLFTLLGEKLAQGIGEMFGMSKSEIQILSACITVVLAVVASIAGGAAAGESAATEVAEEAENAVSQFKNAASRFTSINTFASAVGNSNAFHDLFYGSYMEAHPDANPEKVEEYAKIFSMAMNLVVAVASMALDAQALYKGGQSAADFSTIAARFGKNMVTNIMRGMITIQVVSNLAQSAAAVGQGVIAKQIAELQANLTKTQGELGFSEGLIGQMNQGSTTLNNFQRQIQDELTNLLGHKQNLASPEFTEAQALRENNQKA